MNISLELELTKFWNVRYELNFRILWKLKLKLKLLNSSNLNCKFKNSLLG